MPRLMSCSLTEQAVMDRTKTVTRRLGWAFLKPGDRLTLCRKVMGRRSADGTVEPLVRLAEVEVVDVRREPLSAITDDDVSREGVDPAKFLRVEYGFGSPAARWARWYAESMHCDLDTEVTRIEFRYLTEIPGQVDIFGGEVE